MATCVKITWDTSNEHQIQNPDNYSYSQENPRPPNCERYDVYGTFEYRARSPFNRCQPGNPISSRRLIVNGSYYQRVNANNGYNPQINFVSETIRQGSCGDFNRYGWSITLYKSDCQTVASNYITWVTSVDGIGTFINLEYYDVVTGQQLPKKLIINDGGIIFEYSLRDENSVEVIEYECNQCPENTLDCEDCCLPCDDILNRICNIKNIFIGV